MTPNPLRGKIKLIGISGGARCGKDTLARALVGQFGYRQYSFAEPIYKMLNTLPYLEHLNSNIDTEEKERIISFYGRSPRQLLQTLGTEWGRNQVNMGLWVSILQGKLEIKYDITRHATYVISDMRFHNEAEWVRSIGGICVRVHRGHEIQIAKHVSEAGIRDDLIDVRVGNNSTIEDLCQQAPKLDDLAEARRTSAQ